MQIDIAFDQAEALGRSLDLIIPERLRARHWAGYAETMRSGKTRYGNGDLLAVPALRKDGVQISIEFTILPFRDASGRIAGIAAIMRDVTKRFDEMRARAEEAIAGFEKAVGLEHPNVAMSRMSLAMATIILR